jgi:hypothetical protein
VAPTTTLGSGVSNPAGVATDSGGNIYVSDSSEATNGSSRVGSIGVYPAGSNATVAPLAMTTRQVSAT